MPYIDQNRRAELDPVITPITDALRSVKDGDVNYVITRIIDELYGKGGYSLYNRAMGVLDCAAREFYRRRVSPYEDQKITENGEVYKVQ